MELERWEVDRLRQLLPLLGEQFPLGHPWREGPAVHLHRKRPTKTMTFCGLSVVPVFSSVGRIKRRKQRIRVTTDHKRVTCLSCMGGVSKHLKFLMRWWRLGAVSNNPYWLERDRDLIRKADEEWRFSELSGLDLSRALFALETLLQEKRRSFLASFERAQPHSELPKTVNVGDGQ